MVGFSILGLIDPPGRIVAGKAMFEGHDLVGLPERTLRGLRGNRISMVFQDPLTTLSPTMRIGRQMTNVIAAHRAMPKAEARRRCGDLRQELTIAYLFISHDLGVVERLSDRVAVMYLGRIVEIAARDDLFSRPKHPYTQAFLDAVPKIGRDRAHSVKISGERPSPLDPLAGCHFHHRCPHATERCRLEASQLKAVGADRSAACHLYE